ncbi:MAG: hypothetical protein ABR499_02205 [Gemmatimonadaceae bacterium]
MLGVRITLAAVPSARRYWVALAAVALLAVGGVVVAGRRESMDRSGGLDAGAAFVDALLARTEAADRPRDVSFADAVALGYLERLRLGLGSPFRLIEYASHDPRLDSTARRRVAWALVGRTLRGESYVVEPAALAGVALPVATDSQSASVARAARHLTLVESAVDGAPDPRAGELAVRLAYALAAAERTVERSAVTFVAPVAALVRDRKSAMSDARRLLKAARTGNVDPLSLLATWRRERRFAVERPAAELIGEATEAAAMARVPALLDSIRAIARHLPMDTAAARPAGRARAAAPLLRPAVAERLASGVARYAPPQTPVVTAVRHHAPGLLGADGSATALRREFVERAVNEEAFAAQAARLAAHEPHEAPVARVAVAAAAALRTYAQETPWFPGDPAPTDDELRREFGVASVRFDGGVPSQWRPYYRRMLADGLRDLSRIFPAVSLDGARIRFRSGGLGGATLAMHDPSSRTIHLPIATASGALAHEVAHDLDWQMGRRRYGRRGSYGTDVVVREQRGRLAASLRGLTSARLIPPVGPNGARPPDEVRPAEVFARTLDWFVSIALAREGRVNGYLSAVQDEVLTGHVAVLPRDVGGWSAQALADVLEETTLVGAPLREWLLAQWGPARGRRPFTLVREVLAAPMTRGSGTTTRLGDGADAPRCGALPAASPARSRAALARLAAEARARGVLRTRAQRYPEAARPSWAASLLGQGPWSPELGEDAVRRLAAVILTRVEEAGAIGAALGWAEPAAEVTSRSTAIAALNGCSLRID